MGQFLFPPSKPLPLDRSGSTRLYQHLWLPHGLVSSHWITIHAQQYSSLGSSRTATTWAKHLCFHTHCGCFVISKSNRFVKSYSTWKQQFFELGTQDLPPANHIYAIQSSLGHGFDLPSVLATLALSHLSTI